MEDTVGTPRRARHPPPGEAPRQLRRVTKVLGPLTPENTRMLLMSVVDRDRLWTLSKDGKVAVHLNIRQSDKPIADGKVSLVAYNDVVEVNDGSVWPADTRFLARPET